MKRIRTLSTITMALVCTMPIAGKTFAEDASNLYFAGGAISLSLRDGSFEFDDVNATQDTARSSALLGGFSVGKRYWLASFMRIQVGAAFNFGHITMDTLKEKYIEKYSLVHVALEPQLQFCLPPQERLTPFLCVGGGLNWMFYRERFFSLESPHKEVQFSDLTPQQQTRICPSIIAGGGADIMLSRDMGIAIGYTFRYWRPVALDYQMDLFEPVKYKERFLTHMLQVQFLFMFE
jgi:hypothetical protein